MPLWNNKDNIESQPKWLSKMYIPAGYSTIFVDLEESQNPTARANGIKGPGWYLYREWTDAQGSTRHDVELLVSMKTSGAVAGDTNTDDAILGVDNNAPVVTITGQPSNASGTVGDTAAFVVIATTDNTAFGLTYQWQLSTDSGTTYADIAGATDATYSIASLDLAMNGDMFQVIVSSGVTSVTSDPVTLTVA